MIVTGHCGFLQSESILDTAYGFFGMVQGSLERNGGRLTLCCAAGPVPSQSGRRGGGFGPADKGTCQRRTIDDTNKQRSTET